MDPTEWKIARPGEACKECKARFLVGQTYYSALHENGAGFERRDYCARCFRNLRPEELFSFWKTSVPERDTALKPVLDVASVLDFFRRLGGEQAQQRMALRYVLALMLTRKKVLRLTGQSRRRGGPVVLLFTERPGGTQHEVEQPDLSEQELTAVGEELGRLLGLAGNTPTAGPPAPGSGPASA